MIASLPSHPVPDTKTVQEGLEKCIRKVRQNLNRWKEKYPAPSSINGKYEDIDNIEWTNSFWTGMLWLAYENTMDKSFLENARFQTEDFAKRLNKRIALEHHDIGFLYTLSCVADSKVTGNKQAAETAIKAADLLCERYLEPAGIIQAWGSLEDPENRGRIIIDCLMNLPLLYFAAAQSGDRRYEQIARSHALKAAQQLIREDNTTFHTFFFDVNTGEPLYGKTHQGAFDDSCWARGQAWGIYGFMLSYRYTKEPVFLEKARALMEYFLKALPQDGICYWDMVFRDGAFEPRDSSAMAIAACGAVEMLQVLPLTDYFTTTLISFLSKTFYTLNNYYVSQNPHEDGVLLHSTYAKNPLNLGVDEFNIWGDYYFMELCTRLLHPWNPYW